MDELKIKDYDKKKYSQKDMWWAIGRIVVATYFVTMIYYEFRDGQRIQNEIKNIQENGMIEYEEKIDVVYIYFNDKDTETNRRLDIKTERNKGHIDKNAEDIEKLQEPNTDKE